MEPILPNQTNISPDYQEILKEVGRQLKTRKKDLLKRTLLISWPLIIVSICAYIFKQVDTQKAFAKIGLTSVDPITFWMTVSSLCILIAIYYYFVSVLVTIEKHLWIDSFFDKKGIDSKTSWHIAWKLILPIAQLTLQIFLRFYLLPIVILFFLFISFFNTVSHSSPLFANQGEIFTVGYVILAISAIIYFYLLRIRLRFTFFLFLDNYNKITFSYGALFKELHRLNTISKTDGFKKALVVNFGTDAVYSIMLYALEAIQNGLNSLGLVGGFVGAATRPLAEEGLRQVKSYARLTAIYLLYRQARISLYNKPQEINEYITQL